MEAAMDEYEAMGDDMITDMVRSTEREIFSSATTGDDDYDQNNQMVDENSQLESWDGSDLPIEEVAHRNLFGDTSTGHDKPMEMQDQLSLQAENDALRQQNAAITAAYNEHVAAPTRALQEQAELEQFRNAMYNNFGAVLSYDDQKDGALLAGMRTASQHAGALQANRINASMAHAHEKYGQDFEDAYNDVVSMNTNSPLARNIVQTMCATSDPGEALMELHNNGLVRALGPSRAPPFMPQGYNPPHAFRPSQSVDYMHGDWDRVRREDAEVWNYAAGPTDEEGWRY
jgi:hypothetical protein